MRRHILRPRRSWSSSIPSTGHASSKHTSVPFACPMKLTGYAIILHKEKNRKEGPLGCDIAKVSSTLAFFFCHLRVTLGLRACYTRNTGSLPAYTYQVHGKAVSFVREREGLKTQNTFFPSLSKETFYKSQVYTWYTHSRKSTSGISSIFSQFTIIHSTTYYTRSRISCHTWHNWHSQSSRSHRTYSQGPRSLSHV